MMISVRQALSSSRLNIHAHEAGFLKQRSTTNYLLECYNDWTICVQTKSQVAVVYIDFCKAFDVISHPKLMNRLFHYGMCGTVLLWLENFFASRTHQTKVDGSLSDVVYLLSGIVQGSGVGPLMFHQ